MPGIETRANRRNEIERRAVAREMEIRSVANGTGGDTLKFTGYASVIDAPYEMGDMWGEYTEVVRAGAFAKTLSEGADVPFKVNHAGLTLARTKSGTMRLAEDSTGLHVDADLDPASPDVQSLRSAMQRGDLDEMSFGFRVVRQEWSPDWSQRDITEVNLNKGDVSAVNYGANPATAGASLRSADFTAALAEWRLHADPEEVARALSMLADEAGAKAAKLVEHQAIMSVRTRAATTF